MSTRLPVLAAPLTGLVLLLAACGSPAPASDPTVGSSVSAAGSTGASDGPSSTPSSTAALTTTSSAPATGQPDGTTGDSSAPESAPAPDGDLGPALDAIIPGLGDAGDGPFMEVCGQLSIGSERWLVETVAAGEYAPYVADEYITPEQATRIVDVIEPHCG